MSDPKRAKLNDDGASSGTGDNLRSLIFQVQDEGKSATLSVLDQLLLPHETTYLPIPDVQAAWTVIRTMQIRGAPLIAIVAVLGLAVDLSSNNDTIKELNDLDDSGVVDYVAKKMEYLKTSRPTAVNLFNAMEELETIVKEASSNSDGNGSARERVVKSIMDHAQLMLQRDVSDNKAIGTFGADDLLERHTDPDGVRVVTICNTGSLATAGWGTALGVARELQRRGKLKSIAALETRP